MLGQSCAHFVRFERILGSSWSPNLVPHALRNLWFRLERLRKSYLGPGERCCGTFGRSFGSLRNLSMLGFRRSGAMSGHLFTTSGYFFQGKAKISKVGGLCREDFVWSRDTFCPVWGDFGGILVAFWDHFWAWKRHFAWALQRVLFCHLVCDFSIHELMVLRTKDCHKLVTNPWFLQWFC